jgi:hypothetical protein
LRFAERHKTQVFEVADRDGCARARTAIRDPIARLSIV